MSCASVAIVLRKTWKFSFDNPSLSANGVGTRRRFVSGIHEPVVAVGKNEGIG